MYFLHSLGNDSPVGDHSLASFEDTLYFLHSPREKQKSCPVKFVKQLFNRVNFYFPSLAPLSGASFENTLYFWFDVFVAVLSVFVLIIDPFHVFGKNINTIIFWGVAIVGLLPVLLSAIRALSNRKLTIDLLASIALIFALLSKEFHSAVFISLMLALMI
ncbi:hypothetical protein KKA09_02020 [Patescibacteria group bacterium]|nr:hypothetical protein [Patescibacteria group bacterium]